MKTQDGRWRTTPELWEKLKPLAHEKRRITTDSEKILWKHIRNRNLFGFIFRRQHCIGQFIVDFYCYKAKLVIEVDGEIHRYRPQEDKAKQEYLENLKLKVLRFSNDDVLAHIDKVVLQIKEYLLNII